MGRFTILLPPAEGKSEGGNPFAPDMFDYRSSSTFNYFSDLNPERRRLIEGVQTFIEAGEGLEGVFGVKGDALEEALQANLGIFNAPLMSALDRYSPGIMFKSMDFAGLPTGAQRRLLEHSIIFSGLFGLLRPDDLIPNYRLKMDANVPEVGKVSRYWRPFISPLLNKTIEGHFVWNLMPGSHNEAWDDDHSYDQMIEVKFMTENGGERKAITHGVKPLRGQLVNFVVREVLESLDDLMEWEHPAGFRADPDATVVDEEKRTATVTMVKAE